MKRKGKKLLRILALVPLALLAFAALWCYQASGLGRMKARRPDPIPPGDYGYTVEYADYRVQQLMERHHLPSVALALIDDQHVVWQETFGLANVEEEIPATTNTVYRLWSVSKVLTAIETMRLVEEGLVDLDAPS
jgi:CubicO group peptidase (beta-lactamase class C family)